MIAKKSVKTRTFTLRVDPEFVAAAQKAAQLTSRSVSGMMVFAARSYLRERFPECFDDSLEVGLIPKKAKASN